MSELKTWKRQTKKNPKNKIKIPGSLSCPVSLGASLVGPGLQGTELGLQGSLAFPLEPPRRTLHPSLTPPLREKWVKSTRR